MADIAPGGRAEVIVSDPRNLSKRYWRGGVVCAVLATGLMPAAVRAQAMFVAGFVPAGMYQVEQSFDGEPRQSFEFCFPVARPEDVFSSAGCINELDKTQAGLTHFVHRCPGTERTIILRQVDARSWDASEEFMTHPPNQAQLAANMATLGTQLERQARNGNAREQAEARRSLAEIDGIRAEVKAAPMAQWEAYRPHKFAWRLRRIAERCDFGKQK